MPDWLIDGNLTLLVLIGLASALCSYVWTKTQKKHWLMAAIAVAGFLGLLVLLDWLYESDREQITGNVTAMAAAVAPLDFDKIFSHIAADFHYSTVNKSEFRLRCESIGKSRRVREMTVWSIKIPSVDKANGSAEVTFQFKIKADALMEESFFLCKGTWVKERDGRWRLKAFLVYPLSTADQPMVIPGVG